MPTPTFFIAGYWGFGNLGDEAVLAVTILDIRSLYPDARIIVTSERPSVTEAMHPVEAVGWRSLKDYLSAIAESDHVIVGGGGLWNSYFSTPVDTIPADTSNYAEHIYKIPVVARLLEKPVTIHCVGGGVINGDSMNVLASLGLACASTISVRDSRTLEFFKNSLGVSEPLVAGDPAFRLMSAIDSSDAFNDLLDWVEREKPLIAVVRPWMNQELEEYAEDLVPVLAGAARLTGKPLLFIAFDRAIDEADSLSDDTKLINEICSRLPRDIHTKRFNEEVHPSSILRLIESASAVISMRLHGCILAVSAARPLLALEYDPKIGAVLSDIGLEDRVVKISAMTPSDCNDVLVQAMSAAGLAVSARAAEYAKLLSVRAQSFLNSATLGASISHLPKALKSLVPHLVERSLRVQSLVGHRLPLFAQVARDAVNDGHTELALGMLAILRLHDPGCGEWYYLEGVVHSVDAWNEDYAFNMLDKAQALGFDTIWIHYVRACIYLRLGRHEEAIAEWDASRVAVVNHPAFASFEAAFDLFVPKAEGPSR